MRVEATGVVLYPCSLCGQDTSADHYCSGCGHLVCGTCDVNHLLYQMKPHLPLDHRVRSETHTIGH